MALTTHLAGIPLKNPFILASSPATASREMIERAFKAGWAGAVIKTLPQDVEEQPANVTPRIQAVRAKGRIMAFGNIELGSMRSAEVWHEDIVLLKRRYSDRALIVSMFSCAEPDPERWQRVARMCQRAGADALEINASCPHGGGEEGGMGAIAQRLDLLHQTITWVRNASSLPILLKVPFACDLGAVATIASTAGASAITAIDALPCIPGIDVHTDAPMLGVSGKGALAGLSGRAIKPLALGSIVQLKRKTRLPVCGVGGIYDWQDAAEFILAGASAVQVCSAVLEHGYSVIAQLTEGFFRWLDSRGFNSVRAAVGKALPNIVPHRDLDRSWKGRAACRADKCVRCGVCSASCRDAGFQAITWERGKVPVVNHRRCDGCGLCVQLCPTQSMSLEVPQ